MLLPLRAGHLCTAVEKDTGNLKKTRAAKPDQAIQDLIRVSA